MTLIRHTNSNISKIFLFSFIIYFVRTITCPQLIGIWDLESYPTPPLLTYGRDHHSIRVNIIDVTQTSINIHTRQVNKHRHFALINLCVSDWGSRFFWCGRGKRIGLDFTFFLRCEPSIISVPDRTARNCLQVKFLYVSDWGLDWIGGPWILGDHVFPRYWDDEKKSQTIKCFWLHVSCSYLCTQFFDVITTRFNGYD